MEIEDICRLARAEGLSYGQYVLRHRAELSGKPPRPRLRPGERNCRLCGRSFVPVNSRHRFCRDACRIKWNREKQRKMKAKEIKADER